jgi:hypothetical protein
MKNIVMWISMSLAGLALGVILNGLTGGIYTAMISILTGTIMFVPTMQMISTAKQKGFLPLYINLKTEDGIKTEKFIAFPDNFGRLKIMIVNTRHEGICSKKGLGIIDDKGTEYAWGNEPFSFGEPRLGTTINVKPARYTELLSKNRDIKDYDEAIKKYLGETKYKNFVEKYRKIQDPDIFNINDELQRLIDETNPENQLKEKVFGETWGFKDFVNFLKYAFNPTAMENVIETVKIWTKREQMGYRDTDKAMSRAKAIVMVIIGVIILVVVLTSIDLGKILPH